MSVWLSRAGLCGRWLFNACLLILFVMGSGAAYGPGHPSVFVDMSLQKVSDRVYFVQGLAGAATENAGFISNAGFIVTEQGIVVFDALGTPFLAQKLLGLIRTISTAPIRFVVTSHYHADHIYGLQVFKKQGADVIAPRGARDYLLSETAAALLVARRELLAPWVNQRTRLVQPDRIVDGEHRFELGGVRFTVTYLGSVHSEGDLTLYVDPDDVLFSGDIIFEGRIPFVGNANTGKWLDVLQRTESAEIKALIPGHGPAAGNPREALELTRRYLKFLREKMALAVENWQPFDEAYDGVDWSEYKHLPAFALANRPNAYNVYLSFEQESLTPK